MKPLYKSLNTKNEKYIIINTDKITTLSEQIKGLRSSYNIIITDGSPFLVNNMFCKDSKISVIDNLTKNQIKIFLKLKYVIDTCCEINNNTYEYIRIQS
jgi:hypothetical protein